MNIHNAAENGNLNRVKELLNQGVPVNARNAYGFTPLHKAASGGHVNVVKELLRRGAHVNPRNFLGSTPLHTALNPNVFHALIKAGANPKYRNTINGTNAFNTALTNNNRNAIKTSRAATKWINIVPKLKAARKERKAKVERVLGFSGLLGSVLNRNSIAHIVRQLNSKSIANMARHLKNVNKKKKNNIK
jgi:ankyrin repeat protein